MKKYISVGAVLVVCLLVLSGCTEQQRKDNGQIDPDVRDEQVDTNTNELLEQAISDAILSHNKDVFRDGDRQTFTTEYHEVIKLHARSSHHEGRKPAGVVDWRRTVQGRFFYAAMSALIKLVSCSPVEPQIVQPSSGKRTHSKVKP